MAALVANPGPKLHIHLLSADQLEQLRFLAPHLGIVPAPPGDGASLKITAHVATQLIRLGRREGWCPERGGLPVTIDEGLDHLAKLGLVG